MPRQGTPSAVVQSILNLQAVWSIIAARACVATGAPDSLGITWPAGEYAVSGGTPPANALVMQSGGCTPVLNRSLSGVVSEAKASGAFGEVYGARRGVEGLLADDLIPLSAVSDAQWRRVEETPGAALGSTRRKLRDGDLPAILVTLSARRVSACFIIGGNDSAETGHSLGLAARASGYDLRVVNVPKTIDNDLVLTDHTPGYGSAARFVALATMGAGRDAESMGATAPVTVIEVMGRDAGWLAAASVLGKREERDAPHVVCVPEAPVDEDTFVAAVDAACRRFGFAVAVVSDNVRGPDGPLGADAEPWHVDDFGNAYYDSPARHLARLVSRSLGVRARHEAPGTIQRSLAACVSDVDAREAKMVGRAAVRYALEGHTDEIVTLQRVDGPEYVVETGLAPLAEVAARVRRMPPGLFDVDTGLPTDRFTSYAAPLIGGPLPQFGRLT